MATKQNIKVNADKYLKLKHDIARVRHMFDRAFEALEKELLDSVDTNNED